MKKSHETYYILQKLSFTYLYIYIFLYIYFLIFCISGDLTILAKVEDTSAKLHVILELRWVSARNSRNNWFSVPEHNSNDVNKSTKCVINITSAISVSQENTLDFVRFKAKLRRNKSPPIPFSRTTSSRASSSPSDGYSEAKNARTRHSSVNKRRVPLYLYIWRSQDFSCTSIYIGVTYRQMIKTEGNWSV